MRTTGLHTGMIPLKTGKTLLNSGILPQRHTSTHLTRHSQNPHKRYQVSSLRGTKQSRYSTDFDTPRIASYLAMTATLILYHFAQKFIAERRTPSMDRKRGTGNTIDFCASPLCRFTLLPSTFSLLPSTCSLLPSTFSLPTVPVPTFWKTMNQALTSVDRKWGLGYGTPVPVPTFCRPMKRPQTPMDGPQRSMNRPQVSIDGPHRSMEVPQRSMKVPQRPMDGPQVSMDGLQRSIEEIQVSIRELQRSIAGIQILLNFSKSIMENIKSALNPLRKTGTGLLYPRWVLHNVLETNN